MIQIQVKTVPTPFYCKKIRLGNCGHFLIQMRSRILVCAALCCCWLTVAAQSVDKADKIRVGVKGGVHFSNMHYSNLNQFDVSGLNSGVGGIFAEFDLGESRRFTLRPEILFLSRGSEVDGLDENGDVFNYRLKAKYTDLRVPIIYNFNNPDKISPFVYVAPILSFARGGGIDYATEVDGEMLPWPSLDASTANLSKFDFSAAVGLGVRIPVRITESKRLHLTLEANYQFGFLDTYGSKEKDGQAIALNKSIYDITGTRKNRGFEVSLGVSVPMSIFKKSKKKKVVEPVYTPVVEPEPVVVEQVEEKPCYTLDEILQLVADNQPIAGKTICAIEQINFAFGKSDIEPSSYEYLDKIALLMKESGIRMEVKGHTDNVGNENFNMELSKKRAKAVYDYLIGKGIDPQKLTYSYYGMSKPITTNDTEEGRRINRRVEFEVLN